jgi:L-2,4-diaminobutyric acid acetyltransferase
MPKDVSSTERDSITFRKPDHEDGAAIWDLIRACKPLDENSLYCNLIQCDHFRDTCVVAEMDGRIVGWISGHIMPNDDETLFVWQVAVHEDARGRGLGHRMLRAILSRKECAGVHRVQTTITADNASSWALFTKFADRTGAELDSQAYYTRDTHFRGIHATEHMVTIRLAEPIRLAA